MALDIAFRNFSRVLLGLFVCFNLSCKEDGCFKKAGKHIAETRAITSPFSSLEINDNLHVDIYLDTLDYIEVAGGENVVSQVKTYVSESTLKLENKNKCSWMRDFDQDIRLSLHVRNFQSLVYKGSGMVQFMDTLIQDQFNLTANEGTGSIRLLVHCKDLRVSLYGILVDLTLKGKTERSNFYFSESSWIVADELESKESSIVNESSGDCIVNASDTIRCSILRTGNIQYKGSPEILLIEKKGNGSVKPYSP